MADRLLAVILAGGGGTRLWPVVGPGRPKPLLPWGGAGRTLLAAARDRACPPVDRDRVRILSASSLVEPLRQDLPEMAREEFWEEPSPRNSGPALLLAAHRIRAEEGDAIMVVLPADHRLEDEVAFRDALTRAIEEAGKGHLVTLGVVPDRPATGYGYLELGPESGSGARTVSRFVEKPDKETARRYLEDGTHLWNAGVFVWRASRFLEAYETHTPEVAAPMARASAALTAGDHQASRLWDLVPAGSVDCQLMEKALGVVTVPLEAGWDDLGNWEAVRRLAERDPAGLGARVDHLGEDAPGTCVLDFTASAGEEPVALVGVADLLVVRGAGGTLVLGPEGADRVRRVAEGKATTSHPSD